MERVTIDTLNQRMVNLNRRLNPGRTPAEYGEDGRHVSYQRRNGYVALDEYRGRVWVRTITAGTMREIADFVHAMMVGIDLARPES